MVRMLGTIATLFLLSVRGGGASQIQNSEVNPLTLGLYATPEFQQPVKLKNQGQIPHWLSGSLYRGAAATWDSGNYTAEHLFDGFSRNHRFEITDGEIMYRSRNASDELLDFVAETGLYPGGSFGGDPCKIIFGAFEVTYRDGTNPVGNTSSDTVSVAFAPNFPGLHNVSSTDPFKSLVATTDQNLLQEIDPVSLEPLELFTYQASNPELIDSGRSAAHPAIGFNGELYNYVLDITAAPPVYKIFRVNPSGFADILANITDAPVAYIHSLFSTENYLLLVVWQADIDVSKLGIYYNVLDTLKPWNSERKTIFYVIDKESGTVTSKYTSASFFAFHQVNSFEDPETNSIVIDLPAYPNYEFLEAARLENLRRNIGRRNASASLDLPTTFHRYRLHDYARGSRTSNGTLIAQPAELDFELDFKTGNIELPRINDVYRGKPYQFAYGVHIEQKGHFCDSIIKVDVETQKTSIWKPKTDHMPTEPIFVARPGASAEDDGVLITVALDAEHRHSSLIIIDAKNMEELARADMPLVMGNGFHGAWAQ